MHGWDSGHRKGWVLAEGSRKGWGRQGRDRPEGGRAMQHTVPTLCRRRGHGGDLGFCPGPLTSSLRGGGGGQSGSYRTLQLIPAERDPKATALLLQKGFS